MYNDLVMNNYNQFFLFLQIKLSLLKISGTNAKISGNQIKEFDFTMHRRVNSAKVPPSLKRNRKKQKKKFRTLHNYYQQNFPYSGETAQTLLIVHLCVFPQ